MDDIYPFNAAMLSDGFELSLRVEPDTVERVIARHIWLVVASADDLPKIRIGLHYGDSASWSLASSTFDYIASKSSTNPAELLQAWKESIDDETWMNIKSSYKGDDGRIGCMPDEVFKLRMIHDGCIMLLHALYLLGYFPDNEAPFARTYSLKECYESLFFPGNQICNSMLQKLLQQDFFKQIIERIKWRKPSDFFGKALYISLLKPNPNLNVIDQVSGWGATKAYFLNDKEDVLKEEPCDVLHALHLLLLGERGNNNRVSSIFDDSSFSTASDLNTKGISLKGVKNIGIRGLEFKSNRFGGELCMPIIPADEHIDLVFQVLTKYECTPNFTNEEREVTSYLGLLKDLIHTISDTNMLARKGVLKGDLIFRNNFAITLGDMHCSITCEHIKYVKLQARDYTGVNWASWQKLWTALKIIASLSILPTVYTILEYYKKQNSPMH